MANQNPLWREASDWFGKSLAVLIVIFCPGAIGYWVDGKLGTRFLSPLGFIVGTIFGTIGLVALVQSKTRIKLGRFDKIGPVRDVRESEPHGGLKIDESLQPNDAERISGRNQKETL